MITVDITRCFAKGYISAVVMGAGKSRLLVVRNFVKRSLCWTAVRSHAAILFRLLFNRWLVRLSARRW